MSRGYTSRGKCLGGTCPEGLCPRTIHNIHVICMICVYIYSLTRRSSRCQLLCERRFLYSVGPR